MLRTPSCFTASTLRPSKVLPQLQLVKDAAELFIADPCFAQLLVKQIPIYLTMVWDREMQWLPRLGQNDMGALTADDPAEFF